MRALFFGAIVFVCTSACTFGHDTWVQTNTNIIRSGDSVYVDLMHGNHGNGHRDFKLANKVDLSKATLECVAPDHTYDLKLSS